MEALHEKLKSLTDQKKAIEMSLERTKSQKELLTGLSQQFGNKNVSYVGLQTYVLIVSIYLTYSI